MRRRVRANRGAAGESADSKATAGPQQPPKTIVEYDSRTGEANLQQHPASPPIAAIDLYHRVAIDCLTLGKLAEGAAENLPETAAGFVERYVAAMGPQNPAERMLVVQMLWQHARLARLFRLQAVATRVDHLKALDTAIDAGLNVYRRQMLAWQELRQPRPVQLIAGRQVNVAGQQVVHNAPTPLNPLSETNQANEQGSADAQPRQTAALPADADGQTPWPGIQRSARRVMPLRDVAP